MEALLDPRSFNFKPTPEDRQTMEKWKWRLAGVYGAALLFMALMVAAAPHHKSEIAGDRSAPGSSVAAVMDGWPTP